MMIPVRCFSCGKVVASAFEAFQERTAAGENPKEVMDELGVTRYCCRRMIVSQTDILGEAANYS